LQASGSSPTLSIKKSSGTAYNNGSNYVNNPNHPSLTSDPATNISKIYRYYISGSTPIIDTGVVNAGYTEIDNKQYVDTTTGTLATVGAGFYSIQRVFWIPNSPTNAFIVYYGNARYGNLVDAKNGLDTETFIEAPNTAQNGILIGYIIVQGGGVGTPARDLLNSSEAAIIQAGLFRNVGGIGSSGTAPIASTLAGLSDVSISSRTSGDLLVYNGSQWVNSKSFNSTYNITGSLGVTSNIAASTINATSFTGSLQGTSSWAVTASYALNGTLAGSGTATVGTTTTILTVATGSYTAGFFEYTVSSGSNARAGTLASVWNGASIQYTDNSTLDIGNTSEVTMSVTLSGASALLRATTVAYPWTVKTNYRLI
jgi:hypothetical protein